MDFTSDDFATVDVEHHVPVKIQPLHACRQPGDVPCPQTVRFGRAMARRGPCARFLGTSPMMLLLLGFQYPVDGRLRRQVLAPARQRRHDLARRTAGKLSAVGERENLPPLVFAELVGRRRAAAAFASVRLAIAVFPRPALIGAQADIEHLAGLCAPASDATSILT
ncbi:hypothetical protein D3C81_1357610 [compost metagenome]